MKFKFKDQYWLKSGFFTLLQNMSMVFFGVGSFYILVRVLDKNSFGAWALFMATTSILEVIRNGLVQNALIKFLAVSKKEDHPKIISSSFSISGVLTLCCIALNLLFANYLSNLWNAPQLLPMFYTYNIVFVLSGILTQFQFVEQANFRFTGIFWSVFIRQGSLFAFVLTCFIFQVEIRLISLVYVQIMGTLLAMALILLYSRNNFSFSFKEHTLWIKKLFNYGKYAFGTSVSSMIFNSIDQMMLGALVSASAAGAYNIAIRITNLVEIPTSSVAAIVFPQSARRIETDGKEAVKHLYEKSVGTILALLLPGLLFIFLFPDLVVTLLAGNTYPETIPILQVTILYCLLIPYGRQFGTLLDSMGKPKLTFCIVLICATINIVLNYILISKFGIIGAAYGTLSANAIGFVIAQSVLRKELNVNLLNTLIHAKNFYFEFFNKYLRPSFER